MSHSDELFEVDISFYKIFSLSDRRGLPAGAKDRPTQATAALVLRRYDHIFVGGGRRALPDAWPGQL
jgi:hypothetical protein